MKNTGLIIALGVMSSIAIAATVADGPVTIKGAECVAKSYPSFWEEYKKLGGHYE